MWVGLTLVPHDRQSARDEENPRHEIIGQVRDVVSDPSLVTDPGEISGQRLVDQCVARCLGGSVEIIGYKPHPEHGEAEDKPRTQQQYLPDQVPSHRLPERNEPEAHRVRKERDHD